MSADVPETGGLSVSPDWVGDPAAVGDLLRGLGFREDVVEALAEAARELAGRPEELHGITDFAKRWFSTRDGRIESTGHPLREALVVVSTFPTVIERDRLMGIPPDITSATLLDLQRYMDDFRARNAAWGFTYTHWLWNHVTGKLFEIEGLQFAPGCWTFPFVVYRVGGHLVPLAADGLLLDDCGYPRKNPPGVRACLDETPGAVRGFPVDPGSGAVTLREPRLPSDARRLLGAGDPVLNLHIPAGADLTPENCRLSFEKALGFFDRHFPVDGERTIICTSWLLDRELSKVLPAGSRIIGFGRMFFPLILPDADDAQLVERVLDTPPGRETSLQQKIHSHRAAGGRFRLTSGFLFPEILEKPGA
jgi:hypothetical protein